MPARHLLRPAAVGLAVAGVVAAGALSLPAAAAAAPVTLGSGSTPATTVFPDDRFTVTDPAQQTGRRVDLPTAGCDAQGRSLCDDLALINTLDGFDLQPRVTLPFSGPVDLLSITPTTVHLSTTGPTGTVTDVGGLTQLVLDPATGTVAGVPNAFLSPDTTYSIVVTDGVKAADGSAVDPCGNGCAQRVTTFTTLTPTNVLDKARAALDDKSAYADAGITNTAVSLNAASDGTHSVFPNIGLTITRQDQVFADPTKPLRGQTGTGTSQVLNPSTSAYVGFGSILSPQYADDQGVIPTVPTGATPHPLSAARIGVSLMAGAPSPARCLKPVVFGPGFTRSKYDVFLSDDALAARGYAVFATDPLGHAYGPKSTWTVTQGPVVTVGDGFGRGHDLDGDGVITESEGVGPSYTVKKNADGSVARTATGATIPDVASPQALVGLRDGLIQTVVDDMALVRAVQKGVDVNGDGTVDTCVGTAAAPQPVSYYGQSFGGIYGTMLLGTDPQVTTGVANVPGGPIVDIARESGFRDNIARQLAANAPSLLNGGPGLRGFTEDEPLRLDPRVVAPRPGAVAIQEYFARGNWIERAGSPETYAPRLSGTGRFASKATLFQTAYTDGTVPNPTAGTLYRALNDYSKVWVYRNDRTPTADKNPHGFLLDPTLSGRNMGQQQVTEFIDNGLAIDPDQSGPVWERATSTATNYKVQLDCLHYADPQTGMARVVAVNPAGVADCSDRSGTLAATTPAPSGSATPTATPTATASPTTSPTPSPTATVTPVAPKLTGLSPRTVTAGQPVAATATGTPGQVVELLAEKSNSTSYLVVRTGTVPSNGTARFTGLTPVINTLYAVRTKGASTRSSSLAETVRSSVSLSARKVKTLTWSFSGSVYPHRSGAVVTLYRVTSKGLVTLGSAREDTYGRWRVNHVFGSRGTRSFVATAPANNTNAAGRSVQRSYAIS